MLPFAYAKRPSRVIEQTFELLQTGQLPDLTSDVAGSLLYIRVFQTKEHLVSDALAAGR